MEQNVNLKLRACDSVQDSKFYTPVPLIMSVGNRTVLHAAATQMLCMMHLLSAFDIRHFLYVAKTERSHVFLVYLYASVYKYMT